MAFSYQVPFSRVSATSLYLFPFRVSSAWATGRSCMGVRYGKADREPTTRMLCLAKNSLTGSAAGHSTWSRCRSEEMVTIFEAISNNILKALQDCSIKSLIHVVSLVKQFMMYQTLYVKGSDQLHLEFWPQVQPFLKWRYCSNMMD